VNVGDNAGPIYIVDETVPTVQIRGPDSHYKVPVERQLSAVPLPGSFVPAEGSDKSAGIYRPSTNELWELWLYSPRGEIPWIPLVTSFLNGVRHGVAI
jgi:hypothetical protein